MDLAKLQEKLAKIIEQNKNKQIEPTRVPRAPWGHQLNAILENYSYELVGRYPTNIVVKKKEKREKKVFISGGVSKLLS